MLGVWGRGYTVPESMKIREGGMERFQRGTGLDCAESMKNEPDSYIVYLLNTLE